jgi:cation diffusion facilitator CzcD-associated flavoprotein CzcO
MTQNGIEMQDGTTFTLDAIVCATGFDTSFRPSFPVIGRDKKDLREVWREEPRSYLSIAASGFPNYFSEFLFNHNHQSFTTSLTVGLD